MRWVGAVLLAISLALIYAGATSASAPGRISAAGMSMIVGGVAGLAGAAILIASWL